MFSIRAARLCRLSTMTRLSAKSFSDVAATKTAAAPKVVAAPVQAVAASSGGSTFGQRLSSCLVGMAIGYR